MNYISINRINYMNNYIYQTNGRSLIHNTPPWVSIDKRMCLVKTLLEKPRCDKKSTSFYIILFFTSSNSPPHVNLHHSISIL